MAAHRAAKRAASIPTELTSRDRWVSHTADKRPITADGKPASSTNAATWSPYSQIRDLDRRGFVLGDGVGCIDLDHCLVDGEPNDAARAFLATLPPTYIEISPSGDGLHIWGRLPEAPGTRQTLGGLSVERYSVGRYITITERPFRGSVSTLADLSGVST